MEACCTLETLGGDTRTAMAAKYAVLGCAGVITVEAGRCHALNDVEINEGGHQSEKVKDLRVSASAVVFHG